MKFTPLAVAAAILSTSVSAKSSVLRGPTAEIPLGESPDENHAPPGYPHSSSTGRLNRANFGDGSCVGYWDCYQASATIGNDSCLGDLSCFSSSGTIGDRSCKGRSACYNSKATIENDSCLGEFSCQWATASIGDDSCSDKLSCNEASGFILNGSCKGHASCQKSSALVGPNSCNGLFSCAGTTGIIAGDSCNIDYECKDKHHTYSCMAASTGFTKVQKLLGVVTGSEIKELQHLVVGDTIMGVNENKTEVDDCEVVSVSTQGNGTVFGNYTSDHYILSADGNNTVAHGGDGEEKNVEVFQVLSSCPLNVDESGKKTTFSICGEVLYDGGPMPWSDYLKIHGIIFKIVKETGVRDLSAFHNLDDATQRLPGLCSSGLTCAKEGDCGEFEAKMMDLIRKDLVPDARKKVYAAFRHLGDASKEGSISFMVSKGLSGAIASE